MDIRHFSHDHPLVLKEVLPEADDGKFICYACQEPLSTLESAYVCGQCKYFLHKVCAALSREITHPQHDEHSLTLFHRPAYDVGTYYCDVCGITDLKGFVYHCSPCNYDICMACAPKVNDTLCAAFKDHIIRHDGHQHSLILQPKSALFHCDACDVEDKDMSYTCPSCPFWIHESCASLPSSSKHKDHDHHALSLAYGLPSDYTNYLFNCEVCGKSILPAYWVYYCGPCRYFVHLKCVRIETQQNEANSDVEYDDANFEDKLLKILLDDYDDAVYLPMTDISKELIGHFLLEKNMLGEIQPEIKHFSHEEHPLILFHEQNHDDIEDEEEILCNGCIEPISAPYYCCVECSYFLHLACAKLPKKLQHPSHHHLLTLNCCLNFCVIFNCNTCGQDSNGFFFECKSCDFFLDIKCAAFPTVIHHKNHKHPLFQCAASNKACNSCGYPCRGLNFGCKSCDFYLSFQCLMLPPTIRHRWDPHPFLLRFPPFSEHPDDFDCDLCEKEMHPKRWIYRCSDQCDNTFHPKCVPKFSKYTNIKFGGTVKVISHTHSLKFVRKATLKSSCDLCGKDLNLCTVFECEDCNYCLCHPCVCKLS